MQCLEPTDYSSSLTAVRLAEGHSADALRALILRRFNMSLGNGLGILKDRVFRIGHLGDINDLTLLGAHIRSGDGTEARRRADRERRRRRGNGGVDGGGRGGSRASR